MSEIENYFTLVPRLEKARDESGLLGIEYKRVMDGFSFILHSPHQVQSVTVHRGFLTNGSSLPFIARRLIDKWIGLDHPSVILNDWLSEYLLIEVNYKGILINNYDALDIFIKALELTSASLSNSMFRDTVMEAKAEVEKGGALAIPIARSEYFPLLVSSMIAVGEETGEIDAVLTKVSQYYKEEVDVATTNMSSILEPVFLIIMGLAIGFIALGVYMPMFQLSSAIG